MTNHPPSPADMRETIRHAYGWAGPFARFLAVGRLYICPFATLVSHVPEGARLLDIGCGSGVFLTLLRAGRRIRQGSGVDASQAAVETARRAAETMDGGPDVTFHYRPVEDGLPDGPFDAVSMIDVLHHVDPAHQREAVLAATARVGAGGVFIFKDIKPRPLWRAWANRMHDLVLARQWIHYVDGRDVESWVEQAGFDLTHKQDIDMLWYGHQLLVFARPGPRDPRDHEGPEP